MYLSRNGGLYGATGEVYPKRAEHSMCGDCGERNALSGDWLCAHCRRRLDAELRREQAGMREGGE